MSSGPNGKSKYRSLERNKSGVFELVAGKVEVGRQKKAPHNPVLRVTILGGDKLDIMFIDKNALKHLCVLEGGEL